jgi:hypothetical protein
MRTFVRSIAVLAVTAGLVAACSAAATSTPASTSAPSAPTATPALSDPTSTPARTAAPSVGPMEPAYVTGTAILSQTNPGTTTLDGDCTRIDGVVVEATGTNTDPRAAGGKTSFTISGIDCGGVGFEWGTMSTTDADGVWKGPCTGGMWNSEDASNISCWLVGSGAYRGLTYYMHARNVGNLVDVDGVILPAAPPPAP